MLEKIIIGTLVVMMTFAIVCGHRYNTDEDYRMRVEQTADTSIIDSWIVEAFR